ncbi:hypothetical protein NUW58_g4477 [Xylaria curta]|uniref:Uncharacterized protein n=1 Tax=Xylaria curta TaxID=42375 RepID=A0ACC1P741_9PEZI|nr:hypothetical protein NUW58_g4477 [Xylaria curta]
MAEVKASFPKSSSITTFIRENNPGSCIRAQLAAIGKEAKIHLTPRTAETTAVTTTNNSRDLAAEVEAVCVPSQNETDSGYGTTPLNREATEPTKPTRKTLTFSRKPVPQQFLNRLLDIRALFTEPLLDTVSAKQRPTKGASMKLKYADDDDDKIYLVIQCDRRDKKKVRKFFTQSHVTEMIGNDITVHITTGLRQLAAEKLEVYGSIIGIASSGTPIRIEGAHGSSMATLGGVISIVKYGRTILRGLTAGHVLTRLVHNSGRPSSSRWSGIEGDLDNPYDGSSDSSNDDQSDIFPEAHFDHTSWAPVGLGSHMGNIIEHSFQSTSSSTNYDWALIELRPNYLLVAPSSEFVETHDVVLDDGFSLQLGDSGSWVIHETTGEVYGHVVSTDMFGEVYVIPMNHTLRDIQAHLHADHVGLLQESGGVIGATSLTGQIDESTWPLEGSDTVNNQPMATNVLFWQQQDPWSTQQRLGLTFLSPSIEGPPEEPAPAQCRSISGQTMDSGYVTDFRRWPDNVSEIGSTMVHQIGTACTPKSPPKSPRMEGPYELKQDKDTKHQQAVKKFICVHPSANGLEVDIPIIRPLEKCRACRAGKEYSTYYHAAAHLRQVHFQARPSRLEGNTAPIVAQFRAQPLMKELKSWMKEMWVDSVDATSPNGEQESDETMETEG